MNMSFQPIKEEAKSDYTSICQSKHYQVKYCTLHVHLLRIHSMIALIAAVDMVGSAWVPCNDLRMHT